MSETASSGAGIAPSRQLVAGLVLALANFMVILDLSIANVSIPHIAGNLGITLEQGAWVITSYAVAEAICVPLTGWVAGRFGSVRTFLFSMVGFGICSFLCGISVTMGMLVASRIGQGIFGAFLMPMSQTLLLSVFPPEKRNMAMGLWAVTLLMGPALGPMIGGYLTENYSWHWIFLINLPVAILCIVVGFALLRPIETERQILPIDYVGLALLVLWVGCLQIVLDLGRNHDWFADPMIVALAITSAVGFIVFIIWELGEDHPIVDLRVLRHRGFSVSLTVLSLAFAGYFAGFVVVPQWQQAWLGFPATAAGLSSSFSAMGGLITAPVVAFLMSRLDLRVLVSCGVTWIAAMTLVRTTWTTDSDFWTLSIPQFVQGLGTPFMMLPLMTLTLNTVEENEVASAAGLQSFMRTIATAVATSITLSYWGDTQRIARSDAVAVLQPEAAQASLSSLGFPSEQIRQVLSNMVELEATTLALIHTFWATTAVLLFAAALIWLAPRPSKSGGITMGH
ncbi:MULTISPECIES: DHA2 family efflux MFS transporter permease subunit [Novosphingobium]|uniref:MFS transporter n=3 Tax=Novosphingobium TaxID=165696 RepID=A0ABQ2JZT8_9SPHN|nr:MULTISPECIES: DHA2 family efflux MFS transporter permease subunit [Novosphingobium]KHS43771.1 putative MFS permease [Novosphingobium subterraneum]MCT2401750.1 DHA2 family efflux MFS transporter permease subunit [Novosphingobium mangrovi (ex Huang et al. 2023)]GGN59440.1 MFS transporter [Novosphingobium indicum]